MSGTIGILLSSAGRRVALMDCFRAAVCRLGLKPRLLAVDADPGWSPACWRADGFAAVPRCDDPSFPAAVLAFCRREKAGLLIPTIDPELPVYARHAAAFRAAGVHVAVPDAGFVAVAGDKLETVSFLRRCGVATPATWPLATSAEPAPADFPLIAKPRRGSAGVGVTVLETPADIGRFRARQADAASGWLLQSCCRGRELTVHCYYRRGRLLAAVPHRRHRVRDGEVCLGETVVSAAAAAAAARIGAAWPALSGVICFQGFESEEGFAVTEINARFGGGYPLAEMAGAGFARALLEETLGREPRVTGDYVAGMRMLRYDAAVFVGPDGKPREPPC